MRHQALALVMIAGEHWNAHYYYTFSSRSRRRYPEARDGSLGCSRSTHRLVSVRSSA